MQTEFFMSLVSKLIDLSEFILMLIYWIIINYCTFFWKLCD